MTVTTMPAEPDVGERQGPGFFDAWSRVYDLRPVQRTIYEPNHDAVVRTLADLDARRVLDVGSGTGILAARLRELPGERFVVGCDFSAGMVEQAARRSRRVPWLQADALELPVCDGAIDAIVSTEAFHWFPDQAQAIAEFHRVLRPGGAVVLILSMPRSPLGSTILNTLSRAGGQPGTWPTPHRLRSQLERAGFAVSAPTPVPRVGAIAFGSRLTVATRR